MLAKWSRRARAACALAPLGRGRRPGALAIEQVSDALLFGCGQLGIVRREIAAYREPALDGGTAADLVEPALKMLELLDVLALALPVHRPGVADDVGDRV